MKWPAKPCRFLPLLLALASLLLPLSGSATPEKTVFPTTVDSDTLELVSTASQNRFIFEGNVTIRATDLYATCARLEVITSRLAKEGESIGEFGKIETILATGDVRVQQADREATAGRMIILPAEGKIFLEESPVLRDQRGVLTGYRMTITEGERTVRIESGDSDNRPRAILPDIRGLGLNQPTSRSQTPLPSEPEDLPSDTQTSEAAIRP
ncbi:MAG: LptA/OstA family protein [Puniceicoccaceae bacterium]